MRDWLYRHGWWLMAPWLIALIVSGCILADIRSWTYGLFATWVGALFVPVWLAWVTLSRPTPPKILPRRPEKTAWTPEEQRKWTRLSETSIEGIRLTDTQQAPVGIVFRHPDGEKVILAWSPSGLKIEGYW